MGLVSKRILFFSLFFFFLFFFFFIILADSDSRKTTPSNNDSFSSPPLIFDQQNQRTNFSPFRPSIAVIVGVLTTMFSITFLLLLYTKHCKGGNGVRYGNHTGPVPPSLTARRNSGIDRTVIESLPIFRFASLRGQKDGLECAVCLTRFELTEVLKLLPKCKHAFHVECVDTWLDSHSTCPLCRYRVDPEDILLIEENQILPPPQENGRNRSESEPEFKRVSGRHSSAGERQICLPRHQFHDTTSSLRMSLDSAVAVGRFDRPRKDGLLLGDGLMADRKSFERRFEHRISIVSGGGGGGGGLHQRWSDVQPLDLLYLRSEKIINDSRRLSLGSTWQSIRRQQEHVSIDGGVESGSSVINGRSVSEITGLSRFFNSECNGINRSNRQRQAQAGLVSRWLAWISSRSLTQPAVRSDHSSSITIV
ncbi:RING-H2 finger protein ATL43 [Pistacia vera]|uniref:RING-H2 finger protein ATL43 n=1 Tax=Pistacia vera TaxID=55513 RepID=UPI0012633FE4|nr:RING-H2 finger protein ATL43 [Pistacia vera]